MGRAKKLHQKKMALTEDERGVSIHYRSHDISPTRKLFNKTFPKGYEIIATPAWNLQCGLFAVQYSLKHQFDLDIEFSDLEDALKREMLVECRWQWNRA